MKLEYFILIPQSCLFVVLLVVASVAVASKIGCHLTVDIGPRLHDALTRPIQLDAPDVPRPVEEDFEDETVPPAPI